MLMLLYTVVAFANKNIANVLNDSVLKGDEHVDR